MFVFFLIDSLNGYLNAMPDERFLVLQMHELLSFLNQLGVLTIMVLAQHGLLGQMQTPDRSQLFERRRHHAALFRGGRAGSSSNLCCQKAQRHARKCNS